MADYAGDVAIGADGEEGGAARVALAGLRGHRQGGEVGLAERAHARGANPFLAGVAGAGGALAEADRVEALADERRVQGARIERDRRRAGLAQGEDGEVVLERGEIEVGVRDRVGDVGEHAAALHRRAEEDAVAVVAADPAVGGGEHVVRRDERARAADDAGRADNRDHRRIAGVGRAVGDRGGVNAREVGRAGGQREEQEQPRPGSSHLRSI